MNPNLSEPFLLEETHHNMQFLEHPQETVCFSGHRTKSLPTEPIHGVHPFVLIQILLFFLIEEALDDGYRYFINGGAEGVDLWAATYIMHKMQAGRTDLHLISALPAPRHIQLYHGETRFRLYRILEQSEAVIYVSRQRKRNYNLIRNAYMTDHATRLLAVVKNDKSGTGNTIRQAQEKQLALRILDLSEADDLFGQVLEAYPDLATLTNMAQCSRYYETHFRTTGISREPFYKVAY